ncbi:glycoside hydrolase family 2 TIM barrel-domain containing protein [Kineosporia babensis]
MTESTPYVLDLSGRWRAALDREHVGEHQNWYTAEALPDAAELDLPGSVQEQGLGDPVTLETPWTGLVVDRSYFTDERYAPYREPGQVAVPFWLQPHTYYRGAVWFQRSIDIPQQWQGRRVILHLERVHWESTVWLDNRRIDSARSLTTPHRFDLGVVEAGRRTLTLRVDNRTVVDVGPNAHSISDHTQGNWNGVIGSLRLEALPAVVIRSVTVIPDLAGRSARVRIDIASDSAGVGQGRVTVSARRFNVPGEHVTDEIMSEFDDQREADLSERGMIEGGAHLDLDLPLGEQAEAWDEFHPALYELTARMFTTVGAQQHEHAYRTVFGLREVGVQGTQIAVNGNVTFIRGTLESCVHPLTGYPPTDVESWRRIIRVNRAHGLNLLRFHSWCPPEAAFRAADEEGHYLQVEGPLWANQGGAIGEGRPVDAYLYEETDRILREFGNHPSFILMAHGNEPFGRDAEFLGAWVEHWRKRDPRRLYTSAAGWPAIPENDFDNIPDPRTYRWGEELDARFNARPPETETDYRDWVQATPRPIVSHEIGQWCVYPDFAEMAKYTGLMQPKNYEIFADFLREAGMADQAQEFLHASGKLQLLSYKEEVESALRTPGFGGIQLLGLNDFPGQGTALVGVLDAFWDEKPYSTAADWARFCGPTTPLARLPKRVWRTDEELSFTVQVAHFGPAPLQARVSWSLGEADGLVQEGTIALGNSSDFAKVSVPAGTVTSTGRHKLVLRIVDVGGAVFENDWDLWFFGEILEPVADVFETADVDEALRRSGAGESVLLLPDLDRVRTEAVLGFSTVFWNTAWTRNQAPHTLGITHDPQHPALEGFPSDGHTDWQWWSLLHGAKAMVLDGLPIELRPVVQPIDTWFHARRLGALIEARVGAGRLMVCTLNLDGTDPVRARFRASVQRYLASDRFQPAVELRESDILGLFI